ncbi:MAG: hypothetical protein ACC628_22045, partial [Pirellulaceae bacterium]
DASYVFADPGSYDVTVTIQDGDDVMSATIAVEVTTAGIVALSGDLDVDGDVDFDDIDDFVSALNDPSGYETFFGVPATFNGDTDRDGDLDFDDIDDFVAILSGGSSALAGDMDFDGGVDLGDIDDLVLGLTNATAYETLAGVPAALRGDTDGDGDLDFDDIPGFLGPIQERTGALAFSGQGNQPWWFSDKFLAIRVDHPRAGGLGAVAGRSRATGPHLAGRTRENGRTPTDEELAAVWSGQWEWLGRFDPDWL